MTNISTIWKDILAPGFDAQSTEGAKKVATVLEAAKSSNSKAVVAFGTSGWRAEIGSEFTMRNVQIVGKALVQMYQNASPELFTALGIQSFEELQSRGLLIGHDNRVLGKEFCAAVADQFLQVGVKVFFGGQASTPEFSAAAEMLGCACAVNMTPSHNPANYAGIKFNPADGGPAGSEITSVITDISNSLMDTHIFSAVPDALAWESIDILGVYEEFLQKQGTIDFATIDGLLNSGKVSVVLDHVHGATRGRPNRLLKNAACIEYVRTEDNPLFGGVAPEPSSANLLQVRTLIDAKTTPLKLGAIFDPDGDRIRFYDGDREVPMNAFGALAFHYMVVYKKAQGVVAKSVATSNFVNLIAQKLGVPVAETPVGFKNFRPWMKRDANPKALIAFEESDGISGLNNTLEKDAQFGLLLALEIMAVTGKNLGQYLDELYAEFGRLYPERSGFEVEKDLVGAPLIAKVNAVAQKAPVGAQVAVGSGSKTVKELLTMDGVKIIFEDDSWMLIRPSGTEPKVRIYTECRAESEKEDMFEAAKKLFF
jgi:phosphomannomutase